MTVPAGLRAHSVLDESVLSLWDEFAQKAKFLLVDAANPDGKESEPGLIFLQSYILAEDNLILNDLAGQYC